MGLQEIEDKLTLQDRELRLWMLTFLGVSFESIIGTAFFFSYLKTVAINYSGFSGVPSYSGYIVPTLLAYILIPIPYCWLVSRSMKPKRLVSPLNIQGFSIVLIIASYIALYLYYYDVILNSINFDLTAFLSNILLVLLFAGGLLLVSGLFETQAVKFLLGLNGTADDIDLKAWSVDIPFSTITGLMDKEFLEHYDLKLLKRRDNLILFRPYYLGSDKRRVVVGLTPDETDPSKSTIAACGYGRGYYSIYRLDSASQKRDRVVKDFDNRLREVNPAVDILGHPRSSTSDLASEEVRDECLAATESGSSALARVRKSILLTVGLPIILLVVLAIPWHYKLVSTDLFGSAVLFYAFTLLSIYYPEIKERYSTRKSGVA